MLRSALIVAPPRARLTSRETLRIADVASAALSFGWSVSLLVENPSPLLRAAVPGRVVTVGAKPSPLASLLPRPMRLAAVGKSLMRSGRFDVVHGMNEGADVARSVARAFGVPYVAEWVPLPEDEPPPRVAAKTVAAAAAVLLSDEADAADLPAAPNPARVSVLRDPHSEISADAFTVAEFRRALEKLYAYCMWKSEK